MMSILLNYNVFGGNKTTTILHSKGAFKKYEA